MLLKLIGLLCPNLYNQDTETDQMYTHFCYAMARSGDA